MREFVKSLARAAAVVVVSPMLLSFGVRAVLFGRDRAIEGSTQLLAFVPGLLGQYLRRAFLGFALEHCHPTATISFGTIFSRAGARIDERVYIGPMCHLGLVHLERDVLVGAGVHLPSGADTHGIADLSIPIREQPGIERRIRVGHGSWIGNNAVIMADVGHDTVVGAGSVVTRPVAAFVIAGGVPARVIKLRTEGARTAG
jgi:acetyltransferase-like isoleucine patch superfamily enzyme